MFDKGKPIAGRKARYIDDDIRANNEALEDAINFGHDFATGSTQTGEHNDGSAKIYSAAVAPTTKEDGVTALNAGDVGKRLWLDTSVTPNVLKVLTAIGTPNTWTAIGHLAGDTVRLSESASDPAAVENIGFIYTKAANSKTELFMRLDAGGSVVQLTKNALLYLNNAKLDNDTYLKALNEAGNGDVDLIKASADDVPVLAAGAQLAEAIDSEAEDLAIPDKKYVDDQIDAHIVNSLAGANDSNGEARIGDLEIKWGQKAITGTSGTITFTTEGLTAFSNACFQVIVCGGKSSGGTTQTIQSHTPTTTGFQWHTGNAADLAPIRWFAIGR
jgi:hypothetical protein